MHLTQTSRDHLNEIFEDGVLTAAEEAEHERLANDIAAAIANSAGMTILTDSFFGNSSTIPVFTVPTDSDGSGAGSGSGSGGSGSSGGSGDSGSGGYGGSGGGGFQNPQLAYFVATGIWLENAVIVDGLVNSPGFSGGGFGGGEGGGGGGGYQGHILVVGTPDVNGSGQGAVNPIDTPSEFICLGAQSAIAAGTIGAGIGGGIFLLGLGVTPLIPDGEIVGGIVAAGSAVVAGVGMAVSVVACPSPSFG